MRFVYLALIGLLLQMPSVTARALEAYQFERLQAIEAKHQKYQKYRAEGQDQPGDSDDIREVRQQIRENFARLDDAVRGIQARYSEEKKAFVDQRDLEKDLAQAQRHGENLEIAKLTTRKALRSFSTIFGAHGMKKSMQDAACDMVISGANQTADIYSENIMSGVAQIRTIRREEKQAARKKPGR